MMKMSEFERLVGGWMREVDVMEKEKLMEIYVHVPFCVRKCGYCDFLSFVGDEGIWERYMDMLVREIEGSEGGGDAQVRSVFIGGGTPSLVRSEDIERVLAACRERFRFGADVEVTIEANPGTLDRHKLEVYRRAGVNRLSIGLQSSFDSHLEALGRIHRWEQFVESYQLARESGFGNINVDLMSGLPGQTPGQWRSTLEEVIRLEPEHISAYGLIIEEGTPFYQRYSEDDDRRSRGEAVVRLPSEEDERQMYYDTGELLGAAGYHRYELSNYARKGYRCRHNAGYWKRLDYRGFGLGASSLRDGVRFRQTRNLKAYLGSDFARRDEVVLDRRARIEETMFLGLRLIRGVSAGGFEAEFGETLQQVYGEVIEDLERKGLLERVGDYLRLTPQGIDVSNYVLAEFLL